MQVMSLILGLGKSDDFKERTISDLSVCAGVSSFVFSTSMVTSQSLSFDSYKSLYEDSSVEDS